MTRPTIFARSSGAGRAGVAVFRLSGPLAGDALAALSGSVGKPRQARLVRLTLPDGTPLDQGLTLWFPGPASFTGEDVAELHLHGSLAVERALSRALISYGLEPAAAGAFTLRAFEAGKLDLVQAEGLADLLEAETEAQRRQALGQLGGRLSGMAEGWRRQLLAALAALEAAIDFPDEEDVPAGIEGQVWPALTTLRDGMRAALAGAGEAQALREGVTIAITGPPNAGKSSLLNRLAGEEVAIVSEAAGTTRDVLSVRTEMAGRVVTLLDMAGLRETTDDIEREGVRRARAAAARADLRLELSDGRHIDEAAPVTARTIFIANKADISPPPPPNWLALSALTGQGWDAFKAALEAALGGDAEAGLLTRARHAALVERAASRLDWLIEARPFAPEVIGEELRLVLRALEELLGRITPDDVLGDVFSSFCIGK